MASPVESPQGSLQEGRPLEPINFYFYPSVRIEIAKKFRDLEAQMALRWAEHYLNALILQWNRIADDEAHSFALMMSEGERTPEWKMVYSQTVDREDFDVHYSLVCWDSVRGFLELFERSQGDPKIGEILAGIRELLDRARLARNYFEHLDERIEEGRGRTHGRRGGGGGELIVSYEDRKGVVREGAFGREEIRQLARTYIQILEHMGARLQPSFLGREVLKPGGKPPGAFP